MLLQYKQTLILKKIIILCIIPTLILTSYSTGKASAIADTISKIENNLSVEIVYDKIVKDTWSLVNYETCNDSVETINYLTVLSREYAKYPKGYFQLVGIKTIILGKKLRINNQYRAAVPDPYSNFLFLSIDGQDGDFPTEYLIHVMHHELNHCTEYAIWKDMSYKRNDWAKCNRLFFRYKSGGEYAYHHQSIDWYSVTHPKKGFLNLYSTTAQEEDRSELVALIMSDEGRKYIFEYYSKDKILRKKIKMIVGELNAFSNTSNNYWESNLGALIKKQ
ncbi:MAG: hypothetical protein JWP12_479 [Bacteroidetes bacterium]|nr:hypothetical protein [Bacteroidota bacterium]